MAIAPQPLPTKAQQRSQYLAKALEQMRQEPQNIGGWGGLGARLLGQALTQRAANKADRAVEQEAQADLTRRREAISQFTNPMAAALTGQSTAQPTADAADEAMFAQAGGGYQDAQPVPGVAQPAPQQQSQVPPALAQRVQMLANQGPEGLAQAETLMNDYLNRQATAPQLPPEIANDPRMAYLAQTNPQAFTAELSKQYAPQVVAEGGLQSIAGTGQQIRNPRTREFGTQLIRDTPEGIQVLAERGPTYAEQASLIGANRPQAVTTSEGAITSLVSPTGQVQGQIQGRERGVDAATLQRQAEAQQKAAGAIDSNLAKAQRTRDAVARAREQVGFFSAGTLTSPLPFNQARANLEASVDTIKANLSFAELADMRANSPTGGALGGIAVRELDLLGATIASLDTNQSQEQIKRSLDIIDQSLARYEEALNQAKAQGQAGPAVAGGSQGEGVSREAALAELRRRGLIQ